MAITIDEALDQISFAGAELVNGNANHGPMATEALFTMGREDAVLPWIDAYRSRLKYRPSPSLAIPREDWREYLGDRERLGDWIVLFENELSEAPWQEVVRRWVPRLAPAVMAAATHGLIRTAHAARSLSLADTPQRRSELAQGLGFWAARYYSLPGAPSADNAGLAPRTALDRVERLHDETFEGVGSISEQIRGLEDHPEFAPVINLADTSGDLSRFISDTTATFAGVYLANSSNLVAFVHTVTAPSALRLLAPYLDEADARVAARYAWQACAAVYAWFSHRPAPPVEHLEAPSGDLDDLIDRAVTAGGAHSIKLTEACLREYAVNPHPDLPRGSQGRNREGRPGLVHRIGTKNGVRRNCCAGRKCYNAQSFELWDDLYSQSGVVDDGTQSEGATVRSRRDHGGHRGVLPARLDRWPARRATHPRPRGGHAGPRVP